jgi:zinc/manganese transport system substrate-binding protein
MLLILNNRSRFSVRRPASRALVAALAGLGLLLSACGTTAGGSPGASAGDGVVEVVASTSVYGDIVRSIGGDKVSVTSLITRTSQDPHSYEVTTQDKLAVSKAELVVENGGGYDGFIQKLADDTGRDHNNVLNVVEVSGLLQDGQVPSGFNEHVWYSLPAMSRLADALAARLGDLEPSSAETFKKNAAAFSQGLTGLEARLAAIKAAGGPVPVAVTEPVPLYLLEAAGLENKTPVGYTTAIEEDADVPPAVLSEAIRLVGSGEIRLLAYNTQTEGPQTLALKQAAEAAGVPVVNFSETLPDGKSYLQWMTGNVDGIAKALA